VQRAAGFSTFPNVFPAVVAHGKQPFADDGDGDFEQLDHALHRLRTRLDAPGLSTQGGHFPADEGSYEDSTARR
jgi:MarR family transcriptional regulator, 2-MHQ and catechol-resistance regulon repressor